MVGYLVFVKQGKKRLRLKRKDKLEENGKERAGINFQVSDLKKVDYYYHGSHVCSLHFFDVVGWIVDNEYLRFNKTK